MKRIFVLVFLAGTLATAQEQPPRPQESAIADLKLQLAQKDLQIAQLKVQLLQAQGQLVQLLGQQAQAELATVQKAVQDATPKPEAKK